MSLQVSLLAWPIEWTSSGVNKSKPDQADWRSPTGWPGDSMRQWLGPIYCSESLLVVYFNISEVDPGRDQSPFAPKQYGSITDLFLALRRGSCSIFPAMSIYICPGSWTLINLPRPKEIAASLPKQECAIDQATSQPRAGQGSREYSQLHHTTLY